MTALMWQTALLLLGAYFLGAWVACMARRFLFAEADEPAVIQTGPAANKVAAPAPDHRPVAPVAEVPRPVPVAAPKDISSDAVARFEKALSGTGSLAAKAAAPAAPSGGEALLTPPDRSSSGVSTMVEAIRSRAVEAPAAATGSALAAAAAAVSRATTPPPGSSGAQVLPAAAGTSGRGSVAAPVAPGTGSGDDLTRIQGIDAAIMARLNTAGVKRFAEIAAWKPDQVAAIAAALGMPGRIERENWIEQAQILAKGGDTLYSSRRERGEVASAEPSGDAGQPGKLEAVGASAAALAELAGTATVRALSPASVARDNLQRIAGINAEVERLLNVQGVQRYSQIASWAPDDIARFDRLLGSGGRIARENWIEQAQVLDRGGQTAYSREIDRRSGDSARPVNLGDAIAMRAAPAAAGGAPAASNIAMLRSVRSEAFRSGDAVAPGAGGFDDLKRIRGVGVLIEKKLNALGITRYEQVANWTQGDIDRYSDKLDFKGRIERESWVEQARILSTGGTTEFSKRVDRGEVESSKG